jgi:hypothetical protein
MAAQPRLSDQDIKQLIKDVPMGPTPHSIRGISVKTRFVRRDAKTGRFVVINEGTPVAK